MVVQAGRDALVKAPTGTGKTLAYLAPMVHDLQVFPAIPASHQLCHMGSVTANTTSCAA